MQPTMGFAIPTFAEQPRLPNVGRTAGTSHEQVATVNPLIQ
jgi:hypothetical protein